MEVQLLLCMLLAHIIDDFVLQPICLSKLKQKSWWINACKDANKDINQYKYDYLMALCIHAMSWSIMILVPAMLMCIAIPNIIYLSLFVFNFAVHAYIDNLKANKGELNLMADQLMHLCQIVITWNVLINYL